MGWWGVVSVLLLAGRVVATEPAKPAADVTLRLRVQGPAGWPAGPCEFALIGEDEGRGQLSCDGAGRVDFSVPAWLDHLRAWLVSGEAGYAVLDLPDIRAAADAGPVPVRLLAGGTVIGRFVQGGSACPVGGVAIAPRPTAGQAGEWDLRWHGLLWHPSLLATHDPVGWPVGAVSSDADGAFRLTGLPLGEYGISYTQPQSETDLGVARVKFDRDGQVADLGELRIEPEGGWRGVAGRVTGPRGEPVVSQPALVAVWQEDGLRLPRRVRLDASGRFRLWPVPAGQRSLRVSLPGRADRASQVIVLPPGGDVAGLTVRVGARGDRL